MNIVERENPKEKFLAENYLLLVKRYGNEYAKKVVQRLSEIGSATRLSDLVFARPHNLGIPLKGCVSLDTLHPYRLIIRPIKFISANFDLKLITDVSIVHLKRNTHHNGK